MIHGLAYLWWFFIDYIINLSIAIMINSGYFTSRREILTWLSSLLSLEVTRIEQLGSGSLYCQVLDAAYPNKVPLHRVKWAAQLEVDFLHNFRILQTAFERLGISRTIETQKLAKAKYQDNLELIQWMKWNLAPLIALNSPYDAEGRRGKVHVHLLAGKEGKEVREDKENVGKSVGLRSYGSVQQLKPLERTLEKGKSLRMLVSEENKSNIAVKTRKNSIGTTMKPFGERYLSNVLVVQSQEEECF